MTAANEPTAHGGRIGPTVAESVPWWGDEARPATGAPNVIVIVLDDTGWSDFGCFGSEIATPNIDSLADEGVRFNNFHVTPLCSPTRASLLTGKNHHSVGMRFLAVADTGFPNARGELPQGVPTVPGMLRDRGYGTYLVGKWHLAPQHELTPAGPFSNWPLARGFERFYGFLGGASDQYAPELYRDNSPVEPSMDPEYHLSADLVDQSIRYLSDHSSFRPEDPFFLQLAFGATHAPFQAPAEWINRYRGRYTEGWDRLRGERLARQKRVGIVPEDTRLTERDSAVPEWDELTEAQRRIASGGQEAFAGFLEHTDAQIGRLMSWLGDAGLLENTLVAVFSDNGAAGDGGPLGTTNVIGPYNNLSLSESAELAALETIGDRDNPAHYATGWAMAGNTPFRLYKQYVDLGGTRSPLVVRWPGKAPAGEVRSQFVHVIDLVATLLESAVPAESPERESLLAEMHGSSVLPLLKDGSAASPRSTQYFEMLGHRAILHDGWKAVSRHVPGVPFPEDVWRLYDTTRDFSESNDLAQGRPAALSVLEGLWWAEAERYGVLPLDDRSLKELLGATPEAAHQPRETLVLRAGQSHLGFTTRLTGSSRDMDVSARLVRQTGTEQGVILASGTRYGGYVLYILDDRLCFEHRFLGEHIVVRSEIPVPAGPSTAGFRLRQGGGGSAGLDLVIDGLQAGAGQIPTTSTQLAFYGLDVGLDRASQVSDAYTAHSTFPLPPGALKDVTIDFAAAAHDTALLSLNMEANQ
ncbi:arylsulfatase [Arthrobacter sp. B2a2-09]|uniref:arylsulfatase n=1 Tax=Arthrobacter sp. B2a2-09 TaxID=2952822 RepID=UPI0022CD7441|nr:arylsulfatase [Arthrobacter sp. B2a2-09]MCZ9884929.1 arylsulfatase [Arthrobacter sp. B2a2-09]